MTIEVTVLIAVVSCVLGYLAHNRTQKKDVEEKASQSARTNAKLDSISTGVQDIQVQVRSTEKRLDDINDRVIRVEESTKSAHRRLDKMEE